MNRRQSLLIALIVLAIVALACVVFWPFIAAEIIAPIALLAWLLLRIFVLSIDQQTYWYGMVFVVLVSLFRLWPRDFAERPFERHAGGNVALRDLGRWRSYFELTDHDLQNLRNLRWELVRLLLTLYATKQHAEADLRLHEALQRREIALPETIHAFLFPADVPAKPRSYLQRVRDFWLAPLIWVRRRALLRQQRAECLLRIDEILGFLEQSLEMNDGHDDGGRRKQNQY